MVKSSHCLILIFANNGSNWFSGFREEDFFLSLQMEDEGRQVMAIAHLAFWPGVLKIDPDRCPESDIILTRQK